MKPLVRLRELILPEGPRVLDEGARRSIAYTADAPAESEAGRVRSLLNVWERARLAPLEPVHQTIAHEYTYHMARESLRGHARDESLERVLGLPALRDSVIHAVGQIHRLESQILDLEVAGKITRRGSVALGSLSRRYRDAVLDAEWEFLHALPPEFARAEIERVGRLRLPSRDFRFVRKLLRAPGLGRRAYLASHQRGVFGGGRLVTWALTDVPQASRVDENRQALRALCHEWLEVDEKVSRVHARAEALRTLAQLDGARAGAGAVDPVVAGHQLRREALEAEWNLLKTWSERRREAALVMLEQFTLHPKFKRRLRTAITSSRGSLEDFLKTPDNRRRVTSDWSS